MAREKQLLPPGVWSTWLILAGRGFGKTRTGAETIRYWVESGQGKRIALVARTAADVRDVMVEGESGLLAICPPWNKPVYEPSKRRLRWPNGAIATTYSGDKPDQLRGPQHDKAWCDEIAAWRYPDSWDQLQFGMRLGDNPQVIVTTTPRPIKIVREILADPTTVSTRGSTYENSANLAPSALARLKAKYENTRLGQQELYAVLLDDNPFALWKRTNIDANRVSSIPELVRIVVAIDPAVTDNEDSDETGIVVAGVGKDGHGYVLDDMTLSASPDKWAKEAVSAYNKYKADRIVAETNNGGDMIEFTIRTVEKHISFKQVRASRGKVTRAEPVAALYEQNRVHHVGVFAELEDQMCQWMPGEDSPDRMDALVWALTDLLITDVESFARTPAVGLYRRRETNI